MSCGVQALNSSASCLDIAAARTPKTASKTSRINSTRSLPTGVSSHGRFLEGSSPLLRLFGKNVGAACLEQQGLRLPIGFAAIPLVPAERESDKACQKPISCAWVPAIMISGL